ncbi:MAG: F0F1 ATP synthase subunit B [Salaquimonas sp.]
MFISQALAATEEAAHGASGLFPPFDPSSFASQLLWLAITFGIFYYLMSKVVIPRISGILGVRRDRISRDLDEAQRLKDESDAALAAYEQELAEARNSAHAIAQEAKDRAKAEADTKRHASEKALNEKLAASEQQIATIKVKALGEVDGIAADTVSEIVKSLIGGSATKAEIDKAVSAVAR